METVICYLLFVTLVVDIVCSYDAWVYEYFANTQYKEVLMYC